MSDPNNGIYNTVLSYIPGTQQYTEATDHHVQNSSSASEEHHEVHQGSKGTNSSLGGTGTGAGSTVGNTGVGTSGSASAHGNRTGGYESQDALGGSGNASGGNTFGSEGHTFPSGERASGGGLGLGNTSASVGQTQGIGGRVTQDTPSHLQSGQNTATGSKTPASDVNYGTNTTGSAGYDKPSHLHSGQNNTATGSKAPGSDVNYGSNTAGSGGYNTSEPASGQKNQVFYEEDLADDTGTHHSGYKPDGSSQGTQTTHQEHGDGVRGAPIEGENVKGYAIGAPVGSGDTERPNHPGDPSGQVSGAHMEYLPQETDTRDSTGRGTVGKSQGTGDSSFANVKTKDDQGNSSHVISQTSTSHMSHSSVTQL